MKKRTKWLHNLTRINVNKTVYSNYWEMEDSEKNHLSFIPEFRDEARLNFYVNNCLVSSWRLAEVPHTGRLSCGGKVFGADGQHDITYFAIGSDGKRYRHLYIDTETKKVGSRRDHFGKFNRNMYPIHDKDRSFHDQCARLNKKLHSRETKFEQTYERLKKKYVAKWTEDDFNKS
jgi:hypothetical protein